MPPDPTSAPPVAARILALVSIVVAGLCGGLIGFAFVELQCEGDCAAVAGAVGVGGAVFAAGGVAVIAVLVLRAMSEWRTIQTEATPHAPRRRPR